jgi:hypothetical protein
VILGIPLTYVDEIENEADFHFEQNELLNRFGHILKDNKPSEELVIRINVDLMRILTIVDFFSYKNMFSKLGGYKALLDPLLSLFIPCFVLSYLHKLARIIKQTRMKEYIGKLKEIAFPLF